MTAAVIVLASTKGGCGKSTTAVTLAAEAFQAGARVVIIDADPQAHSRMMVERFARSLEEGGHPLAPRKEEIQVVTDCTQDTILDGISAAADAADLVLVDLQGSANQLMLMAMSAADLVIVPTQPSILDLDGVANACRQVASASKVSRRAIAHRVLFVRTPAALQTRVLRDTRAQFQAQGMGVFSTEFVERTAYKEMTFTGEVPSVMAPESNAAKNARALYEEVMGCLAEIAAREVA